MKELVWLYFSNYDTNEEFQEFIEPVKKEEVFEEEESIYIVLTEFTDFCGNKFIGFCSPQDTSGIDYIQPVIIYKDKQIPFFFDKKPTENQIKELEDFQGMFPNLFPIQYEAKIKSDGKNFKGIIENFMIP
jgi:hypothetical protein